MRMQYFIIQYHQQKLSLFLSNRLHPSPIPPIAYSSKQFLSPFSPHPTTLQFIMQINPSPPKSRKSITPFRHFSQNNSPSTSNHELILKDNRILSRHPNRRYNRSTKLESSEKVDQMAHGLDIPESFLSTNLRIREKLRDRSYHAMRSELSTEKERERERERQRPTPTHHNQPYMKPVVPMRETYEKVGREEETTKHFSLFHTNDPEEEDGIEELFYQQVRFLQKCKQLARGAR